MPASNFINATDARKDFFDLLNKLGKNPYPFVITHKSAPQGVLMSWEDYNSWVATMETLADPELVEAIRVGDRDIAAGRYRGWEDVKKELGLDGNVQRSHYQSSRKRSKKTR